jgi:hypothetical protein
MGTRVTEVSPCPELGHSRITHFFRRWQVVHAPSRHLVSHQGTPVADPPDFRLLRTGLARRGWAWVMARSPTCLGRQRGVHADALPSMTKNIQVGIIAVSCCVLHDNRQHESTSECEAKHEGCVLRRPSRRAAPRSTENVVSGWIDAVRRTDSGAWFRSWTRLLPRLVVSPFMIRLGTRFRIVRTPCRCP